ERFWGWHRFIIGSGAVGPSLGSIEPVDFKRTPTETSVMVKTRQTKRRHAFSLIELMVVIALLGLMIAMLLPAIQAARERSRATACSTHLKEIGRALSHFESTRGFFPKGAEGRFDRNHSPTPMYGFSWWVSIMPYLEQSEVADKLDRTHANVGYVQLNSHNC